MACEAKSAHRSWGWLAAVTPVLLRSVVAAVAARGSGQRHQRGRVRARARQRRVRAGAGARARVLPPPPPTHSTLVLAFQQVGAAPNSGGGELRVPARWVQCPNRFDPVAVGEGEDVIAPSQGAPSPLCPTLPQPPLGHSRSHERAQGAGAVRQGQQDRPRQEERPRQELPQEQRQQQVWRVAGQRQQDHQPRQVVRGGGGARGGGAPRAIAGRTQSPPAAILRPPSPAPPPRYGPDRALFLPGGLLARDDINPTLNGTLAGE